MPVCCTTPPTDAHDASPELADMDIAGFGDAIEDLRRTVYASISEADYAHMRRVERWGRLAALVAT